MHVFRRLDAQVRQIQVGLVILEGAHQLVHIVVAMLFVIAVLFVVAVPIYVLTLVRCLRLRVALLRRWRPLHHRWRTHHLYLFGHR